ncbi:putative transcriptional regulatory protein [Colletotrichum tanaceti]|uniref:Putative transcriptional regulatory protein n=1 Tax=Colletotrichum tanaceti TaxID=1306861 RepID=A0A4U6XMI6_9PEZI|nr:putative transcriptional regulatory protein [Colletotrichum tanaceti]TKW56897.1 putative transcriptional regulatory protein [Colletotrichum tanaceti]
MDAMDTESVQSGRTRDKASRIAKACLRCQSKKIKCDGMTPSCTPCVNRNNECVYQQMQRRRGPGRSKMYIQALEERLSKMEAVLSQAGLPRPGAPPTRVSPSETDAASVSVFAGPPVTSGITAAAALIPSTEARQALFARASTDHHPMVMNEAGPSIPGMSQNSSSEQSDQRGSQTPAPPPRDVPEPPKQLSNRMPVFAFIASRMREINTASYCSTFNRQVFTPRLEREEAITMLMPLYDDVVDNYSLLNFHYFVRHFEKLPEADNTFSSTSGWAYMNAVLSVGTRQKSVNNAFQEVCQLAWPFFKNAFSVLTELMVKGTDQLAVQAIVAMAVFMQGTTCMRTAALLSSSAARLSQSIGLHRQPCVMMSMCAQDVEARSRVFWAAYILEKEMGLNHGLDSIQDDDDIETELPSGCGDGGVDVLNLRAKLAMVESSIRRRLYTAKGLRLTDDDLVKAIIDLDALLEEWRLSLPAELQPSYESRQAASPDMAPDMLNLHLAFFRCTMMVHWAARRHNQYPTVAVLAGTSGGFEMPYIQLSFSQKRCRMAAHATIGLFRTMATPQYADLWRILCYPLCASLTLLTDVLENPGYSRARGDLAATRSFAHFLQKFEKSQGCDLKRVLTACAFLQRTAQYAVDDAQNMMHAQNLVGNADDGPGVPLIPGFNLGEDAQFPRPRLTVVPTPAPQVLQALLGAATHPMYLVQGLMGTLPNRDQRLITRLAHLLGTPLESGKPGSPLGPQPLQPETYGFGFGQGQAGNDPTANWS